MFAELGSSPAALQAAKLVDAYGLLPGHTTQQVDAEMAYINANLEGTPTWVRLPPNRVPPKFSKFRDPVFRLVKALYGHPDSGGYWERYAHTILVKGGWKLISPSSWRSTYYHSKLKCLMIVYVDDFKLSGQVQNLAAAWKTIRTEVRTSEPATSGKFLGCDHELSTLSIPDGGDPWRN